MSLDPKSFKGLEISDRLRVVELIEERPFSMLFKGEVLALDRVVGVCSVTVYRPADRVDPDDIVSALRTSGRNLDNSCVFNVQQVGVIRHGEHSGLVYSTGEPVLTTLSLEVEAGRLLGYEDAENVVCQVSKALLQIHANDEVHGRIRPYNILKTGEGWKLSGVDVHTLEERLERFTRLGDEPVYLPPENYRAGLFGKPVDAWALGICVHLGQCGRLPYSGEGNELLEQVLKNPPRIERLSGRSGTVVRHLLSQEADQRWDSQQCIDHITRPRDSAFGQVPDQTGGTTAELRASGRLGPGDRGMGGDGMQGVPTIDTRPLYLRPPFFVVCALCFIALTYIGWERARLPDIPKENAPPDALYSIDFSHTQVDPDGRVITKKPEQSTAYSEELGGGVRIEMVAINPGVFEMGSQPNEPYYEKAEGPKHPVQVAGFFISRFEITQQQWEAVVAAPRISVDLPKEPSSFVGPDRPVEGVTWVQAKEFCNRLSKMTGRLYRLPTEAEWEFACRAGTDTPFCFGETINSALANYQATKPYAHEGKGEYRRETIPVGTLGAANYFGLLDVHGNVSEWCEDRFGEYPEAFIVEPTGPKTGEDRVVRGGSWRSYPWQCRSASRVGFNKDYHRNDIGFRVVLPRVVMVPAEG